MSLANIDFAPLYAQVQQQQEFAPGQLLSDDVVLHRGTGHYHEARREGK